MQKIVLFKKKRVCAYNSIKIPCQIIKNKKNRLISGDISIKIIDIVNNYKNLM